ncbi:MAG: phenylalanine--tRNA ligase subunit alpha [Candidatus Terrybacteria bacterium RIFCSPLOWO2_01_FULL_44_24]|uniref:Phenylalanine--tRNA ligase alpha subunit n=1 Tax=Candidatus Terrybacteria bacterium RIFCSPHIGHO2_01_FULL_43_35 TaxID=1802361 RepID=A0A1G2PD92_9BACT|nr:MAG: phenylalanine--tRNA ligase subunit alpha [Candidatus Terrybacteria bacterium RIFCSPHIGHO2_01_FULL_43_35]OHA50199.1 MAG: phenylalanine--tRNA ligase subunit alpha [Candidatus Terrybacteria bacterium RIFCSPHIGHO2_02_FULL_43_14]OHA51258.1 MAG: phenylalanine--tRNA ligase subunit alpha [Candidatus Terrybacteria bacterium RIFCSPLOWO2_01_FULL_44_24]
MIKRQQSDNIPIIKEEALSKIRIAHSTVELEEIYSFYLGRKGILRNFLITIGQFPAAKRPDYARNIHEAIKAIDMAARDKRGQLLLVEIKNKRSSFDITMPGIAVKRGHLHPLTLVERKIEHIFNSMGFGIIEGPEIEDAWHNFDALNIPPDHPARELWDTFWIKSKISGRAGKAPKSKLLLRTHTSPMQIRYMETHQPPFKIIVPGKAYRFEATDASHEFQFNQIEGLMVGEDVSVANFKFVVQAFFEHFFGKEINIRLRASYFPFTEPSFEVDIRCLFCSGRGCSICARSGWLEMGGAGMVHREVFKAVKYDVSRVQGFAFGFGLERLAMMKYKIPDVRLFNSGDIQLSQQF